MSKFGSDLAWIAYLSQLIGACAQNLQTYQRVDILIYEQTGHYSRNAGQAPDRSAN